MEVSPSGLHLSSSWLPPSLDAVLSSDNLSTTSIRSERAKNLQFSEDRSINRLVIEADLGGIHGEAGIELIESLLTAPSVGEAKGRKAVPYDNYSTLSSWSDFQLNDPPVLALSIDFGRCGYRIRGPNRARKTCFGPGEDDAGLSPGWLAPSVFCLHIPSASVHMSSQYVDVIYKRTEAQRRELKRLFKRGKVSIPEILQEKLADKIQHLSGSNQNRRRGRMFGTEEAGNDSEQIDSETASGSVSPSESPAPIPPLHRHPSDLLASTFITPTDPGSYAHNSPSHALYRPSEEDLRSHPFVYQIDTNLLTGRVEVFLISTNDPSAAQAVRNNPTSAGPSRYAQPRTASSSRASSSQGRQRSRPPLHSRYDIFYLGPFEIASDFEFAGQEVHEICSSGEDTFLTQLHVRHKQGNLRFQIEAVGGDVSRLDVHHGLNGLASTVVRVWEARIGTKHDQQSTQEAEITLAGPALSSISAPPPLVEVLPMDVFIIISLNKINFHLAGPDPKFDPGLCRGLAFQAQSFILESFRQSRGVSGLFSPHIRASLALKEDIRAHSNQQFVTAPHVRQAYFRLYLIQTSINPLKDDGLQSKAVRARAVVDPDGCETTGSEVTWELKNRDKLSERESTGLESRSTERRTGRISYASTKDFFWLPHLTVRISVWVGADPSDSADVNIGKADTLVDHIGVTIDAPILVTRVEVFQIYCFLLALSALSTLKPQKSAQSAGGADTPSRSPRRPRIVFTLRADLPDFHLYLSLPQNVRLFARLRRLRLWNEKVTDITVKFDTALIAGASIAAPGLWDDLVRLRDVSVTVKKEIGNSGFRDIAIYLYGSGGRLRLPFKFPFSLIIDNTATFVKTVKQLVHQFVRGKYTSAIAPHGEEAKHLPKLRIAFKVLVLEAQDDPFETKLNLIWRAGVEEQAERSSRERAFLDKVDALRRAEEEHKDSVMSAGTETDDAEPGRLYREKRLLSSGDAYAVLQSIHSTKWINRHRNAMTTRARREEAQMRRLYGGTGHRMNDSGIPVQLVSTAGTAPLLRMALENPVIEISKPSFASSPNGLVDFLADVGKGQPKDTRYSLLIPFHLNWQMSETRVHLRDYPLPLLYIPPVQQPQSEAKSWQLSTDFVIAEELGGSDSVRLVPSVIVPRSLAAGTAAMPYILQVPRTAMPVKTYALPIINITSTWATRIGWGNSIQPTVQDVMRVIDTLSKAPPDPSERMGFWDKLRLILHWRISINFLGEGPLHFILKGSRDPYSLQGEGAGFALCWSGNIRWKMGFPNKDREFLQIHSDNFVLGIPGKQKMLCFYISGRT